MFHKIKIPLFSQRNILIAFATPTLFVALYLFTCFNTLSLWKEDLCRLQQQLEEKKGRQAHNTYLWQKHRQADPYEINKILEPLSLLTEQEQWLLSLEKSPLLNERAHLERRLDFLQGTENRLRFNESKIYKGPHFQESTEKLVHSVEVNSRDLEQILNALEQSNHLKPHLYISDFSLKRQTSFGTAEVFEMDLTYVKHLFE